MPYSATTIAYIFVRKGIEEGNYVTQMKLQKLIYFAHGLHLAKGCGPLIKENFEAWKFGPVVPSVYQDYKFYGSELINSTEKLFVFSEQPDATPVYNDSSAMETITTTWNLLKDIDAVSLSAWTHKSGSPWTEFYQPGVSSIRIPDSAIESYFKNQFIKD